MSIFKKKSKAKKEEVKQPAVDDKPKPAPYKHVPKHAAADAAVSTEKADKARIAAASRQRMSMAARDYAMNNAAQSQMLAHTAMHGTPSPSSLAGQQLAAQRPFKGMYGMQRNNSAEVFTTDPDAPPMPSSSNAGLGKTTSRSITPKNDYFAQTTMYQTPSFDSPMLGNPKMQMAARDRGYVNPHHSADSGYGSAAHSRAPSEHITLADINGQHLPRTNSGFLPELSLSEELAREPAFSESSFGADEPEVSQKKTPESVLKNGRGYLERQASQQNQSNDSRSLQPSRSQKAPKQTRFEDAPEAATSSTQTEQDQPTQQQSLGQAPQLQQYASLGEPEPHARPESTTLPQPYFALPMRTSTPPITTYEEPRASFTLPERNATPPPQIFAEPQPQRDYTQPTRTSTPPPDRERRVSSPPPQSHFAPIERMVSLGQQSIPPVSRLEGYKVNKRGMILDEEGELIGELSEGDIMDCVRQRVNAYGEVLDDSGNVVGRVRSLQRSQESPIQRISSPTLLMQQEQPYYSHFQDQRRTLSAASNTRREAAPSQSAVFTPAWQQQHIHSPQPVMAQELRDHLAFASLGSPSSPVRPIDFPSNIAAVELPATEVERAPEEETLPLFDLSEIYMPPPSIPAKSPRRPESPSPSPPLEKLKSRPASESQQPTPIAQPAHHSGAVSRDLPRIQTKHLSAPLAPIQHETQQQSSEAAALPMLPVQPEQLQQHQQQRFPRQQLARSASESSTSEVSKSYQRPTVPSVPEDSQIADEDRSPARFSYKGEIPAADGPAPNARLAPPRAVGATTPPIPSLPRAAQYSPAGRLGQTLGPARQFTTGVPGPRPIVAGRNSYNAPMRRSPLSSACMCFPCHHNVI